MFRLKKGCLWVGGGRKSQLGRVDLNGPKEADESLGLAKGPQSPTGSHLPVPPPGNLREGNRSGGKERKEMFWGLEISEGQAEARKGTKHGGQE